MILVVKNIYVENQMVQVKVDTAIKKYLWRRKNIRRKKVYTFWMATKNTLYETTKMYVM